MPEFQYRYCFAAAQVGRRIAYLVVGLDVELNLLAGKCSYSTALVSPADISFFFHCAHNLLDLHLVCPSLPRASMTLMSICAARLPVFALWMIRVPKIRDRGLIFAVGVRMRSGDVIGSSVSECCLR